MGEQLGMVDYFMQTECELIETIQKEATNKGEHNEDNDYDYDYSAAAR